MTQEELDALMASGIDNLDDVENNGNEDLDKFADEENMNDKEEGVYPPPADEKHKVVAQLDEVTKESEEKATQILDIMDNISESMANTVEELNDVMHFLEHEKELFTKLSNAFPHIKTFKDELNRINEMIEKVQKAIGSGEATQDEIMVAMDIMQYQDIHRQKIERVINVMRQLSIYMNHLFSSSIDDSKRVASAKHIEGDERDDLVQKDDIEALIASFGS